MDISKKLEELERRIKALEKSQIVINDLHNYVKGEIRLIEETATNAVLEHLKQTYQTLVTLRPCRDYVNYLWDPFEDSMMITELDGVLVLSNDPSDIQKF